MAGRVQNAGGEGSIYKHVNLHGGVAQDSRTHERENMAQAWMRPIHGGPECESATRQPGELAQQLHGAAEDYAVGHPLNRRDTEARPGPEAGGQSEQQRPHIEE